MTLYISRDCTQIKEEREIYLKWWWVSQIFAFTALQSDNGPGCKIPHIYQKSVAKKLFYSRSRMAANCLLLKIK